MEQLVVLAARGDWPGMAGILEPVRARGDFDRLAWLIAGIEEIAPAMVFPLAERHPDDALLRTVVGARRVAWAWEARTGARASQVSQEQFKRFHERLLEAEEHLYAAVELDPASPLPWRWLTTAARGLGYGIDVTRRRFEAGVARAPYHAELHRQMLEQLCEKWGGSHEEMHLFARESMLKAPAGSALGGLVAIAHLEHWLALPRGEDDAYMRQPHVMQSLREAAARTIDHPDFAAVALPFPGLNQFAMAFWLAGDFAAADRLFQRIGDNATEYPWHYRGNPGAVFAAVRQDCKKRK